MHQGENNHPDQALPNIRVPGEPREARMPQVEDLNDNQGNIFDMFEES